MKILLFSSTKYPHIGGQSVHMEKLGNAFCKLHHEVQYLSPSNIPPLALTALRKSASLTRRLFGPWLWVIYYLYGLRFLLRMLVRSRNRRVRTDIIHAQDPLALTSASMGRGEGPPRVFLTVHGYFTYESVSGRASEGSFMWSFLRKLESKAYRSAELIFTVDENIKKHIESFGVESRRVLLMRNFVDVDEFSPARSRRESRRECGFEFDEFVILCPRRLVKKCGVIYAAWAAKELRNLMEDNFVLVFAGEGNERQRIERYARENELEEKIVFLGNIPHVRMPALIRAADVVLIPSITVGIEREATSISALEAMASGIPVVASNIGGLSELIRDGETGYLVPERDAKAIAEALLRIALTDQSAMTRKAREEVVTKHSHIRRAEEFLGIYEAHSSSRE